MFNINKVRIEGRNSLELPKRGRLDQNQKDILNNHCKQVYVDRLVANDIISKAVGKVAYGASFPINDDNRVERAAGLKKHNISTQKYQAAGGPMIEKILNLEFHDGVAEWAIMEPVAEAARPAESIESRGRKKGTKNRDKAEIAAEKAAKAIRVEARRALGLPERGRLTTEQKELFDKWLEEHSN